MTVPEIIEKTFNPKDGISDVDIKILKRNLGILAELYFADNNRVKWGIVASRGFVCSLEMAIKNILFDIKKRSSIEFDISEQADLFIKKNHILYAK